MNWTKFGRSLSLIVVSATVLSACGTGTKISANGTTDDPKWPKWDSVTFNKDRGTFPDLTALNVVEQGLNKAEPGKFGMTKDQLYYLLGRPHYDEAWRPREWNYLFHFHTPGQGTDDVTTCQYKVTFDEHMFARAGYWNAVDPEDAACPPALKNRQLSRYTLSADALFAFDRSGMGDLNAKGKQDLDELAAKLKTFDQLNGITVVGHTDYLGSDAYNMDLSQRRAITVRQYLINQGLPANLIRAIGVGESQPVKQCANTGNRSALIACLHPNRRVEVEVDGSGIKE